MKRWKIIAACLFLYDAIAVNFSYFLGLWLRFDLRYSQIPEEHFSAFLGFAPVYAVFSGLIFFALHLYGSMWRFASFNELNRIWTASMINL